MDYQIKGTGLELTDAVRKEIDEKLGPLDHWLTGQDITGAWVEVGRTTRHHQEGKIYRAELQIRLAKHSLRAEATAESLGRALTEVKDRLQMELKKMRGKELDKRKRAKS